MRVNKVKIIIDYVMLFDILRTDSKAVLRKLKIWVICALCVAALGISFIFLPVRITPIYVFVLFPATIALVGYWIFSITKHMPRYLHYLPFQRMLEAMEYVTENHSDISFNILDKMPSVDLLFDSWECLRIVEHGVNKMLFDVKDFTLHITDSAGMIHKFSVEQFFTEDTVDTWLKHDYTLIITLDKLYVADTRLAEERVPYTTSCMADMIEW